MFTKIKIFMLRKLKKFYLARWRYCNTKFDEYCDKDCLVEARGWQVSAVKYLKKYSDVTAKLLRMAAL